MTDRAKALVVHLNDDYRLGDGDTGADALMNAISMMQGVSKVEPLVTTADDYFARERVRRELINEVKSVLHS